MEMEAWMAGNIDDRWMDMGAWLDEGGRMDGDG